MADQVDLSLPYSGSESGKANLLRTRGLGRLQESFNNLSEDISDRELRGLANIIQEEVSVQLNKDLLISTRTFFVVQAERLFRVRDATKGGSTFNVDTGGLYKDDITSTNWRELTAAYSRRKRRTTGSANFFVYTDTLRRELAQQLPQHVVDRIPNFIVGIAKIRQGGLSRYEITIKPSRSVLLGYGLGNRVYRGASDRGLQAGVLAKLGFSPSGDIFQKLQNRTTSFRPTVLLLVQHWYTFVLPRVLAQTVRRAASKGVRQKAAGLGSARLEGF